MNYCLILNLIIYHFICFTRSSVSRQLHGVRTGANESGLCRGQETEVSAVPVVQLARPLRIVGPLQLGLTGRVQDVDVVRLHADLKRKVTF